MQQNGRQAAGTARRVGGGNTVTGGAPIFRAAPARGWLLKVWAVIFGWPLFLAMVRGSFRDTFALGLAIVLLWLGGELIARGSREAFESEGRVLTRSPTPRKLLGALAAGAAAFAVSLGVAHDGPGMALLFAAITGGGCVLAYGLDPRLDRGVLEAAAKRAGVNSRDVIAALEEAQRKVEGIEEAAQGLHSRELKSRLDRICRQAYTILGQLEQDPKNLSRARRFLVTYLDGTRDVVTQYAAQQRDLADTPLAENFRRVLTTVEQVFAEQEEVLKQDDKLNLEVQIEVLETQLKREGVH
ncbi:MAG: 5-bromo-4-chloroindolyl phosphate hydrolysis family protein [Geminicoccaceae bacterium]